MKCTLIVIKSRAKISYIASYVLFTTRATVNFMNSKICVAIYNSFTNIVLIPTRVLKLLCLLNIATTLAMEKLHQALVDFLVSLLAIFALTR